MRWITASNSCALGRVSEVEVSMDYLGVHCADARHMHFIPDGAVDLIITSPPYNQGKDYDVHDDEMTWTDYANMLDDVFCECKRVLKVGGRIAVNVAAVERRPYRPLHHKIGEILDFWFNMRGEIIWNKGASVGSSTAWGSWCSASNPTLRDVHEYILVFSKGEYAKGYKGESTITAAEFTEYTKSIWEFPTVSAKKVGHPAPFPLELPSRLIKLYSYKDDVVLDPFCGSGTTCQAAELLGRRWIGVDVSEGYCEMTRKNVEGVKVK